MSRLELHEGRPEAFPPVDAVLALEGANGDETRLRQALEAALRDAAQAGAQRVGLAPDVQALGIPTQRGAEILIEALRAHVGPPEEVLLLLDGEPTYRIYEAVHDAARIAEQMKRLRGS